MRRLIFVAWIFSSFVVETLYPQSGQTGWYQQNSGTSVTLYGVSFVDANIGTAVGANGTIIRTTDGGTTWFPQISGTTSPIHSVSLVDANIGTAVGSGGTLRTTDGGETWVVQSSYSFPKGVCFTNADTGTVVGVLGTVRQTTDGGLTWSDANSGTLYSTLYGVSFVDAQKGIAVGERYDNHIQSVAYPYIWGISWGGWMGPSGPIYSNTLFGASVADSNTATVVGMQGLIVRTTTRGAKWTTQLSGTSATLHGVFFTETETGTAVGTGGTILKTTDGGATWLSQASGTNADLHGVCFTDAYTGTAVGQGGTILRTTSGGIMWVEGDYRMDVPQDFSLSQSYPNPFNPTTEIVYTVKSLPAGQAGRESVSLKVYDMLGREVATLVNEIKQPGQYEVTWDASSFPSGVYFYRLVAGQFSETKKLLLLK